MNRVKELITLLTLMVCLVESSSLISAADNLLANPDLENWEGTLPSGWTKNYSTLAISPVEEVENIRLGAKSVLFQSSSNSTKYLYQVVPVSPNSNYQLSAWTKFLMGSGNSYLRATQCSDTKCESEIKSDDSLHALDSLWKKLELSFTANANATAVKVKISLDPSGSTTTQAVWDDLSLVQSSPVSPSPQFSNPAPASQGAEQDQPEITFAPPSNAEVGTTFTIPIQTKNLPETSYYLKVRIGSDKSHLTMGQTHNDTWLDDNDAWNKFIQVTTNNAGIWEGSVNARLPSDEKSGNYKILVKFKKVSADSSFQSEVKEITFRESSEVSSSPQIVDVAPVANIARSKQTSVGKKEAEEILEEIGDYPDVLGTASARIEPILSGSDPEKASLELLVKGEKQNPWPIRELLLGSGLVLVLLSGAIFWRNKKALQDL